MITSTKSLASERQRRREVRIRHLEQERDQREAAIFDRIPRLAEIKTLQTEIGLDLARSVLRAPTRFRKNFDELRAWSLELSAERADLLVRHKLDSQDLEVQWDCPDCKNTGWLPAQETGNGTVLPPEKCHCLIKEELDDMYRSSGLMGPMQQQTFARFDLSVYPEDAKDHMAQVLHACKHFAGEVRRGEQPDSLLLMGDVGRGKTFLCSAIGNALVEAKRSVVYLTFSDFIDLVRLFKFEDDGEYRDGIQRLLDADLIILDDLGAEKISEFVGQELFNVINHRMNRQKPMVISTNLTPKDVEAFYGARIASRLLGGFRVLVVTGKDVRVVLRRRQETSA